MYLIGKEVTIPVTAKDGGGQPVDPATLIVKVRKPQSGAVVEPAVSHDDVGVYSATVTTDEAGRWFYRVESTNPDDVVEGHFLVGQSNVA